MNEIKSIIKQQWFKYLLAVIGFFIAANTFIDYQQNQNNGRTLMAGGDNADSIIDSLKEHAEFAENWTKVVVKLVKGTAFFSYWEKKDTTESADFGPRPSRKTDQDVLAILTKQLKEENGWIIADDEKNGVTTVTFEKKQLTAESAESPQPPPSVRSAPSTHEAPMDQLLPQLTAESAASPQPPPESPQKPSAQPGGLQPSSSHSDDEEASPSSTSAATRPNSISQMVVVVGLTLIFVIMRL